MLRTTQRNARIAAVLLTAASPLAAAFPVAAQDMKLDAQIAACKQIKDHGKSAQCHADTYRADVKERLQVANASIANSDAILKCSDTLRELIKDPALKAKGMEILAQRGQKVSEYGQCNLVRALTQ